MYFKILLYMGFIATLTFFVRSIFPLLVRKRFGYDVYWHMYCIDEIRKNRHKIPNKLSRTLTSGFFAYPFFVHWVLSFLKKEWVEKIDPFFGAIMDTLHNFFLFFSSAIIFHSLSNSLEIAFLASMIFCFTPMLVKINARTCRLSPRAVGGVLFSISTFLLFQFHWTGKFLYFLISLVLIAFICLSSKFTFQAVVVFYPIFALFLGSIWFLLSVPAGILLALVFTAGLYLRVLKTHLRFLNLWRKKIQFEWKPILDREPLIKIITALPNLIHNPREYFKIIYLNPTVNVISHNPFLLVWGIAFFVKRNYQNLLFDLSVWVIIGILTLLVISTKYLTFLGEPERYFEYVAFPISILSAYEIINSGSFFLASLLFLWSFFVIFINYRSGIRIANQDDFLKFNEVIGYLNSTSKSQNILVIPPDYASLIAYFTHHKVIMFFDNLASNKENEEEHAILKSLSSPNPHVANANLYLLIKKFDLDLIITIKNWGNEYLFSKFFMCFENEKFSVHAVKDLHARASNDLKELNYTAKSVATSPFGR